jgi:hypothetical protein
MKIDNPSSWLSGQIKMLAQRFDMGRAKSVSLPNGRVGREKQRATLKILDMDKALAFAVEHDIPTMTTTTHKVYVDDLKAYATSTGVAPDGCTYDEGGEDTWYIKLTSGKRAA